ncbi:MAG: 4Fe-4S dicluster domain-containing protein [Candidatus Omnitrophota bacterium]
MDTYFINRPNLDRLVKSLFKAYRVYAPFEKEGHRYYNRVRDKGLEDAVLGEYRAVQSIKSFFFPSRQKVSSYFSQDISEKKPRPIVIIGAKSCDLASLKVMDYVFTQDSLKDPFYVAAREEGLIISSDCTSFGKSCFCVALGIMPYPTEDFDINLSELDGGYVAEIGSDKGQKIVREYSKLFQKADLYNEKKDEKRLVLKKELTQEVKAKNIPAKDSIQNLFKDKFDSKLWEETTKTCVECGACNMICPACHCFILKDKEKDGGFERLRLWDSCLLMSFARVAGNANPRKLLSERLRNRFDKKFNFLPNIIGRFGCTGCGRCSDGCPGKIKIDEVLSKLSC